MAANVDEVERELDAFYTDVSEDDLFDYMEQKIKEENGEDLQKAQFLVAYRNHRAIEKISSQINDMESWLKYGATAMIGVSSVTVTVVLSNAI